MLLNLFSATFINMESLNQVASTGAVAILVPHFGEVIGLIGSIGMTSVGCCLSWLKHATSQVEHA